MASHLTCFREDASPLIQRFAARGAPSRRLQAQQVITRLIEAMPRKRFANPVEQLRLLLRQRNVREVHIDPGVACDGVIEPIGSDFAAGFRIRLKMEALDARTRFTVAHELCHTFFYELVPEIKFFSHEPNKEEERLCNFGAAVLLIPASSLRRRAKALPICLDSLDALAASYAVSRPTMALRLKALSLWACELSFWHRMTDGRFAFDRLYGGGPYSCQWEDDSVLQKAWEAERSVFGRTFVIHYDSGGVRRYRTVSYEARPCLEGVIALWGPRVTPPALPLFEARSASQLAQCIRGAW